MTDTGRIVAVTGASSGIGLAAARLFRDRGDKVYCLSRTDPKEPGIREKPIRWLVDDCVKFVEREIRRGNHYDWIIMDPPSYGRGPKGEIWKIEEKIYPFIELCTKILSDDPLFFLVNSYTTGLQPAVLTYMLETQVAAKFGGKVVSDEIGLPVSSNGLVLPCGASGRWEK